MERRTLAGWLGVVALACLGLLLGAGNAGAAETIQGTQSSSDSAAQTGDASGSNSVTFGGGPAASGSTGASSQQLGTNSGAVSQSGSAETGDPLAGAQVTGAVADDVTVQNQNTADNPSAVSGNADVTNAADVELGPAADTTDGPAQAHQIGDNIADVSQDAFGTTGDAVAGAQVTGIVGAGEHVVQNQNTNANGSAFSGNIRMSNTLELDAGPFAASDDEVQASQIGSNDAVLLQAADGTSGDTLNGAQVTGVVGGSATVQTQNSSTTATAQSGVVALANTAVATLGPVASSDTNDAQSEQIGGNTADLTQDVRAATGDALAGSQVAGAVGDQGGFFELQAQQASEDDVAVSGDVQLTNDAVIVASPQALADTTASGTADALVSQIGDNDVTTLQTATGTTGDALAAAQVAGAVDHEDVTIQQQNTSFLPTATTGVATAANSVAVDNAPIAEVGDMGEALDLFEGDDSTDTTQVIDIATGDALAGAQVTGVVASGSTVVVENQNDSELALATSGNATADNIDADVQSIVASTGDASAGSQVTGVVTGSDSSVTIQNQNDAELPLATSGSADATNEGGGDEQSIVASTGDASAGSQVTGAVTGSGSDVTIQNQNDSELALAGSGSVFAENFDASTQSIVASTGDASAGSQTTGVVTGSDSSVTIQNQNVSVLDLATSGSITALNEIFSDEPDDDPQVIDDEGADEAFSQSIVAVTGDALAGAQVTGAVTGSGSDVTIQNQNDAELPLAASGSIDAANNILLPGIAAHAVVPDGEAAQVAVIGDNILVADQAIEAHTGDALSGAQVTGAVTGADSEVTVENQNTSELALAQSGSVNAFNTVSDAFGGPLFVGPFAISTDPGGTVSVSQIGDNIAEITQTIEASSGDALAGSQVTGVVTGPGSEVTVQNQNVSVLDLATSGPVQAVNTLNIGVGPYGEADGTAQVEQIGDNALVYAQTIDATTGDALAGAQVTGIVGAADATTQFANTADAPLANTSTATAANTAEGFVGTVADATTAHSTQDGDSAFAGSQDLVLGSGDAVSGGQISGSVGESGAATAALEETGVPGIGTV